MNLTWLESGVFSCIGSLLSSVKSPVVSLNYGHLLIIDDFSYDGFACIILLQYKLVVFSSAYLPCVQVASQRSAIVVA